MKISKIKFTRKTVMVVAILIGAALLFLSFGAADWRELYCQANPLDCIRRGW